MYDLAGKVAVITGVGRPLGIGRDTALRFAREGTRLVIADLGRITLQAKSEEARAHAAQQIPLGRLTTADDVAKAIIELASSETGSHYRPGAQRQRWIPNELARR